MSRDHKKCNPTYLRRLCKELNFSVDEQVTDKGVALSLFKFLVTENQKHEDILSAIELKYDKSTTINEQEVSPLDLEAYGCLDTCDQSDFQEFVQKEEDMNEDKYTISNFEMRMTSAMQMVRGMRKFEENNTKIYVWPDYVASKWRGQILGQRGRSAGVARTFRSYYRTEAEARTMILQWAKEKSLVYDLQVTMSSKSNKESQSQLFKMIGDNAKVAVKKNTGKEPKQEKNIDLDKVIDDDKNEIDQKEHVQCDQKNENIPGAAGLGFYKDEDDSNKNEDNRDSLDVKNKKSLNNELKSINVDAPDPSDDIANQQNVPAPAPKKCKTEQKDSNSQDIHDLSQSQAPAGDVPKKKKRKAKKSPHT